MRTYCDDIYGIIKQSSGYYTNLRKIQLEYDWKMALCMQSNTNITRLACVFINEKEHINVKELLCSIIISTTTDVVAW